jgi:D-tyrosyl-tRNA(Tyr) deacylase
MRVILQRVSRASVRVDGTDVASIGRGYLLLVGVGLAEKVAGLRVFRDEEGKTNLDLSAVGGEALVVSQFTLYADTRKGRRPSFVDAADPDEAVALVETFAGALESRGVRVARGVFGAEMAVDLVNDGPFTLILEALPASGRA